MTDLFFDTGGLSLFLAGDARLEPFLNQLRNGTARGYTSMQNLVELYAKVMERLGKQTAEAWYWRVMNSDIEVVDRITPREGISAAQLRARHKNVLSLVDAISMALAASRSATLVTTDSGIRDAKEKGSVFHVPTEP
nr:PIN domain-containing protein [Candidatus Sigynarchaeum springense]